MSSNSTTKPAPQQKVSYGRGGAGNVAPLSPSLTPADLETPTIKQQNYTTGRGGSGNIVSNDNPDNARKAQDVGASAAAGKGSGTEKGGAFGRGGAANVVKAKVEAVKEKMSGNGSGNGAGKEKVSSESKKVEK